MENEHCKGCGPYETLLKCDLIQFNQNKECPCSECPIKVECEEMCDVRWDFEGVIGADDLV